MSRLKEFYSPDPWNKEEYRTVESKNGLFYRWSRYELENQSDYNVGNEKIIIDFFKSKRSGKPTVVLHPILAGGNHLMKVYAWYFAAVHGWNAAIIHRANYPFEANTAQGFENRLRDAVAMDIQAYDWMMHFDLLNPKKTVSVGASMGGILNTALVGVIPYKAFISIAGGAPIIDVIMSSEMDDLQQWTREKMDALDLTREQLRSRYDDAVESDPTNLLKDVNGSNVLFVYAMFDKIVPSKYQKTLYKSFKKRPSVWYIPGGHYVTGVISILMLPLMYIWSVFKL